MEVLLYLLVILIIYDLSLHAFELLWLLKLTKANHPLYIGPLFTRLGKGDERRWSLAYQLFWTAYWSVALLLLIVYLVVSQ